jgi:hypothetical protein
LQATQNAVGSADGPLRGREKHAMAIYCCTTSPVSRRAGRSATAAAAYRAGEKIKDAKSGETHDYSKRRGVASADMVYPSGTPENARPSRAALWNMAEASEKRKDSRVAREYMVALPAELDEDERRRLALEFAQTLADRHGCAADCCIHHPGKNGDQRNHHAHILCTSRRIGADGALGEKCDIELGDKDRRKRGLTKAADEVKAVRAIWEDMCNRALDRAGSKERVSAAKREDGLATMHLGPIACGMERRGEATSQGSVNRAVIAARAAAAKAAAAKKALAAAKAAEQQPAAPAEEPEPPEEKSGMEKRRDALLADPLCNDAVRSLLTGQEWEAYVPILEEKMAEMRPRSAAAEEAAIAAAIDETTIRPSTDRRQPSPPRPDLVDRAMGKILPGKPKPKTQDAGRGGWSR